MVAMRSYFRPLVLAQAITSALPYSIDTSETSVTMFDARTGVRAYTLFFDEAADAILEGLLWRDGIGGNATKILNYRTSVNDVQVYQGFLELPEDPLDWPTAINAGTIFSKERGTTLVKVDFWIDGEKNDSVSIEIQTFQKWMAAIPMILICGLGFVKDLHVIYTLLIGLFVGGCMVTGSFVEGFKSIITRYLITAASDEQHVYL